MAGGGSPVESLARHLRPGDDMTTKNGTAKKPVSIDLTDLIEPITIRAGDYEATLSGDMSLTGLARVAKAMQGWSGFMDGDTTLEQIGLSEDELWAVVDEVLQQATPPPTCPVRELLNIGAAIKLIGFLAGRLTVSLTTAAS